MSAGSTAQNAASAPESNVLSFADEVELRAYFALNAPSAPGTQSNFGAVAERMRTGMNPKTTERPSNHAPWTEIVECAWAGAGSMANSVEDAMIAHLDGWRRMARVHQRVTRLRPKHRAALEAHYGTEAEGVLRALGGAAVLTDAAIEANRQRAADGVHETVGETLEHLGAVARDGRKPKREREEARRALLTLRGNGGTLLDQARNAYRSACSVARR